MSESHPNGGKKYADKHPHKHTLNITTKLISSMAFLQPLQPFVLLKIEI